jgi:hypothetical protein
MGKDGEKIILRVNSVRLWYVSLNLTPLTADGPYKPIER